MVRYVGCWIAVSAGAFFLTSTVLAAEEKLFSQNSAFIFAKQAQELYAQNSQNSKQIEQAMTLLDAALELDELSASIPEQVLRIGAGACFAGEDYSPKLTWAMGRYIGNRTDIEVANDAVKCMMEHLNSREEREAMLQKLLLKYNSVNPAFASELAAQLGLLSAEKADMVRAIQYLSRAYELNRYNQLAFIKLQELTVGENLSVTPEAFVLQLRTSLDINPYDLSLAEYYAQVLVQQQLYDLADKAFDYAAKLYMAVNPDTPLPDRLLLPWMASCYLTPRLEQKCMDLADKYRQPERFSLMLEALSGRAAAKLGQPEKAKTILEQAGLKAEKLLQDTSLGQPVRAEELAWYYSFVLHQPEKALAWSNQAYQEAPDRQGVRPIFAYTLAQSGQSELAKEHAEPLGGTDQIASLTMAAVYLAEDNKTQAIDSLRTTVSMEAYSFVAEKAMTMLHDLGSDYIAPLSVESVRQTIASAFGSQTAPDFIPPAKRFSARLLFSGSEFFYGTDFSPRLVIENTGTGPLVIGEGAFLNGNLRVDAVVSGDLNVNLPNLVQRRFKPSKPILAGEHLSIPLDLQTGKLLALLKTYPQASVKIEFTVYLDPIEKNQQIVNNLRDIAPIQAVIQRPGVTVTRDFLMQRLEALSKGQEGQRFRAVELLAGLLAEQKAFQSNPPAYRYMQVDQTLLVDTVRKALLDDNWKIRVQTMDSLMTLSIPLEYGMVRELSSNLNHEKWPVRMMAMLVLAKAQPGSFDKVLEWAAQYDPYLLNRRMAKALRES
jgi:tetratricopeptide (TPR) repeat protein